MTHVYVLYSRSIRRFSTGITFEDPLLRLEKYNADANSNPYTAKGRPWEMLMIVGCASYEHARGVLQRIKRMISTNEIQELTHNPDMVLDLMCMYDGSN